MTPDPWTCAHCRRRFVVPTLAREPNSEHLPGCPLRTSQEDQ